MALVNFIDNKEKLVKQVNQAKVDIDDIVTNPDNIYSVEAITELKESIKKYTLKNNIVVYDKDYNGDYMIASGHRRYAALRELYNEGLIDEQIPVFIIPREDDDIKNKLNIVLSNAQRNLDEKDKIEIVKELISIRKQMNEKPGGQLRDWIAQFLGCTGRTAQKYINKIKNKDIESSQEKEKKYDLNNCLKDLNRIKNKLVSMVELLNEKELSNYVINNSDKNFVTIESSLNIEIKNFELLGELLDKQLKKEKNEN